MPLLLDNFKLARNDVQLSLSGTKACYLQQSLALRIIVIAASIKAHSLIFIVAGGKICAAKIFDGVFEVGFGVQQAACGPAISHCASRIMPDLHQTPIDLVPCGWIKITLPLHNTAHK